MQTRLDTIPSAIEGAHVPRSEPNPESPPDWRDLAECLQYADFVEFFPARGESTREAKAVCAMCRVRQDCLEYALQWDHLSGVWGGLSERERRQVRRGRRTGSRTTAT